MKIKKLCILSVTVALFSMFALTGCNIITDDDSNKMLSDMVANGEIELTVNPMECLSGKTKQEVYNIRKKYVAESIFKSDNYEPSEAIYGGIVDGKPWRSIFSETCTYSYVKQAETKGFSEESRYIDNPAILIGLSNGWYPYIDYWQKKGGFDYSYCFSTISYFLPDRITYSEKDKRITAYYNYIHSLPMPPEKLYLVTINAQDFGYKYGKIVNDKGDLIFTNPNKNISKQICEFNNFIHLGGSCGVEGGCNNASPYHEGYEFYPTISKESRRKVQIDFKLWKQKPENDTVEADMNYRMIFSYNPVPQSVYLQDTKNRQMFGITEPLPDKAN